VPPEYRDDPDLWYAIQASMKADEAQNDNGNSLDINGWDAQGGAAAVEDTESNKNNRSNASSR
jgi:hypothetical protein